MRRVVRTRSQKSLSAKLLRFERLECRAMLAAELFANGVEHSKEDLRSSEGRSSGATHTYWARGEAFGLRIASDRLAIGFHGAATGDGLLSDAAADALLGEDAKLVRSIGRTIGVYAGEDLALESRQQFLRTQAEVAGVFPVFIHDATGSEAVLTDEIIVALRPGVSAAGYFAANTMFASYKPLRGTSDQFIGRLATLTGEAALVYAGELSRDPQLLWAAPNFYQSWQRYFIPNDPRFSNQWHLHNTGQGGGLEGADSSLPEAWDIQQGGAETVVIGIIDDGVAAHPDLIRWTNPGETPGNGVDDDGNGYIDDVHGWNFVADNNSAEPTTATDSHGTAVAGVAAAVGRNNLGVAGASLGSPVLSARIFEGNDVASDANIAEAIYYAAGRTADGSATWPAARVLNNSWGGGGSSTAIDDAILWAASLGNAGDGATVLFASGNGYSGFVGYPANRSATIPGVVAVGATNNFGERSDYSNFGTDLDLVAPSNDLRDGYLAIDTTDRVGAAGYASEDYTGTGSTGFGGTSSATPLAAGIAALALARADAAGESLTSVQMRDLLRANTDLIGNASYDLGTGKNLEFGFGRLNAGSLLAGIGTAEISVHSPVVELVNDENDLDFGFLYVGQSSIAELRIRNQGTEPLNLESVFIQGGPFTIEEGSAPQTLGLGQWTTLVIRATSTEPGLFSTSLVIVSNDADEDVFEIGLVMESAFADISGFAYEDRNGDGSRDASDPGIPGQRIYLDTNNNDLFDVTSDSFTESDPVDIFDQQTVTSTQTVTGLSGPIIDLNVTINVTHTFVSDLEIVLISPSGTRIVLASGVGWSGDNFVETLFDDEASNAIFNGSAPFTGSFRPAQPLSLVDGEDPNGLWSLEVTDFFNEDQGQIQNWTLGIQTGEPFALSDAEGFFLFPDLPEGTYFLRSVVDSESTATGPDGGEYEIVLEEPGDYASDLHFGSARNRRAYFTVFEDLDRDGNQETGEGGLPVQLVHLDMNDDGLFDLDSHNATNSTEVPIVGLEYAYSTIEVTGLLGFVQDVNVRVDISHTWNADLEVYLIAPNGQRVELFTGVGGSSDNFTDTVLDDQAGASILEGSAPFTGPFRPEGLLADLVGLNVNGVWTLEIFDTFSEDSGTLHEWELILTYGDQLFVSNSFGQVDIDLPPGAFAVRLVDFDQWRFTLPSDGRHAITVADAPIYELFFGSVANQPPTDITLSSSVVRENTPTDSPVLVGTLSTADSDPGETHTYELVSGSGADDNALFLIAGDELRVQAGVVLDYELRDSYAIRVQSTDSEGASVQKELTIAVENLPEVESITVGDGTNQRSLVRQVVVWFDQVVSLEAGAFEVSKRGTGGGPVTTNVSSATVSGKTVATLTFSGSFVTAGSLNDGNYELRIIASKITGDGALQLDGDKNGVPGGDRLFGTAAVDKFFRLFGDESGDRIVSLSELNRFRSSYGRSVGQSGYIAAFDFSNDNAITLSDLIAFRARYGSSLPFS